MYLPVSSQTIKYHLNDCGVELKLVKTSVTSEGSMYNIVLNRPGDPVVMGLTSIEENKTAMLFIGTILSFNYRSKPIHEQMGFFEVILAGFVKYAISRNKAVITVVTDSSLITEVMVDLGFSLISPNWKNIGKYKGIMALTSRPPLPF